MWLTSCTNLSGSNPLHGCMPSALEVGSVLWNWHQSSLLSLDSSRLQDTVFSIREAAIQVLQAVAKEFGPDWTRDHIVPQVRCNAVAT